MEMPDHPWVTADSASWRTDINCKKCSKDYAIHGNEHPNSRSIVLKSEVMERSQKSGEYFQGSKALFASPAVQELLQKFCQKIDRQPSVAAIYRLFRQCDLETATENTFRRKWRGSEAWKNGYHSTSELKPILNALGEKSPELEASVADLKALWHESQIPPTPIEPLIDK
jgi:hypothetical protein